MKRRMSSNGVPFVVVCVVVTVVVGVGAAI